MISTLQPRDLSTATSLTGDVSALALRSAFGQFPSGVAALAAYGPDNEPATSRTAHGMVASSFTVGVSLEPPLVSVAVQKTSETWPVLRQQHRIGVSILSEGQHEIAVQMATRGVDRFAGLDLSVHRDAIFLDGAALWLETSLYDQFPAGDHDVALLQVHALAEFTTAADALVFHKSQFRNIWDA